MEVILYIPILILSIVSAFVIFGKLKMIFFGENMLDLGLGIIGAWFFIFFLCVVVWSSIFVYLGIPILIIGGILIVGYFVYSKVNGTSTSENEQTNTGSEKENVEQSSSETVEQENL